MDNHETKTGRVFSALWGAMLSMWLCLFPLWTGSTYASITASKYHMMLILSAVTLTLFIASLIYGKATHAKIVFMPSKLLAIVVCLYLVFLCLSCIFGPYHDALNRFNQKAVLYGCYRHEGLISQICYLTIFLVFASVRPNLKIASYSAAAGVSAFTIFTFSQYLGFNPLGLFPAGKDIVKNYIFQGTIGNIDMVCGYLAIMIPLLMLWYVFNCKSLFHLLSAFLGAVLLFLTQVQSGLIAMLLLLVMLFFLFLSYPKQRQKIVRCVGIILLAFGTSRFVKLPWYDTVEKTQFAASSVGTCIISAAAAAFLASLLFKKPWKLSRKAALLITLSLCALVLVVVAVAPIPKSLDGLYEAHQLLTGHFNPAFGTYRLGVWQQTLRMTRENLLWGTGGDTFLFAFKDFIEENGLQFPEVYDNPHNIFVSCLSSYGLPAFLLFIFLLAFSIFRGVKKGKSTIPFSGASLCFLAQACFTFSLCIVSPMFYAVLGISAGFEEQMPVKTDTLPQTSHCQDSEALLPSEESGTEHTT